MDTKMISRMRLILWMVIAVAIAVVVVYREEIGAWMISELTESAESQIQQILR